MNNSFSISDALSFGWKTFRKNMFFWIVCFALVSAMSGGGGSSFSLPSTDNDGDNTSKISTLKELESNSNSNTDIQLNNRYDYNSEYDSQFEKGTQPSYDELEESLPAKVMGAMTSAKENKSSFNPMWLLVIVPFAMLFVAIFIVVVVFLSLLNTSVQMGYIKQTLRAVRNKELEYGVLLSEINFGKAFSYIVASLLYTLMVFFGLLFFVIPGIYLAIRFQFYGYFIVDKNARITDSLSMSSKITKGAKIKLLSFGCLSMLIVILGFFAFIIGVIPASIIVGLAFAYIYETLRKQAFGELEAEKLSTTE